MPSHLKENEGPLPDNISTFDIEANDIADHYAGPAASRFQIPDEATANFCIMQNASRKTKEDLHIFL